MRLRKFRFSLVYLLALGLFYGAHQNDRSMRLGVLFILLGEVLRVWANGYVGHVKVNWTQAWRGDPKIGQLITAGPYAYVRHPLYLGTFVIGLGFCIIVKNPWLAFGALAFFLAVYPKKVVQEEVILSEEWPKAFEAYRRRVHAWIPRLRPFADQQGTWSWQGIDASQEVKTIMWLIVILTALYLHEEWVLEREPLSWKHALFLAGALGLMGFDLGSEWMRRRIRTSQ